MTIRDKLWNVYLAIQSTGLMPPIVTIALSWRNLTRRQLIKRILIAFGIFWLFNIIVSWMILAGYLPAPPGYEEYVRQR